MFQHFNKSSISPWHIHSLDIKDLHCEFYAVSRGENLSCFWLARVALRKTCFLHGLLL